MELKLAEIRFKCFQCGGELVFAFQPGRRDECPKCHADVHTCRNCKHYDPKVYNECKEPQADVVQEKTRANFCDFFAPGSGVPAADRQKDLLTTAEALFKKK